MFRMNDQRKATLLVTLQLTFVGILLITGPFYSKHPIILGVMVFCLAWGVYAIAYMQIDNFKVDPIPREDVKLRTGGPYKWLRHPMYSALLLYAFMLLLEHFSWFRFGILLALVTTLVVKLFFEESLLVVRFPDYRQYMQRTSRIIPWLF